LGVRILITNCLLFLASSSYSQVTSFQTWLDYNHNQKIKGNWQLKSDYGFRWMNQSELENWWRIHARTGVSFKKSNLFEYKAGLGLFYTDNKSSADIFEFRPWQGMKVSWPNFKRLRFSHYGRLEERFSLDVNNTTRDNFVLKFRYKLGLKIPLNNTVISAGTFYIPVSIELFMDLNGGNVEQNNDRIRIEAGLGYRWREDIYLRILYTFQEVFDNQGAGVNLDAGFKRVDNILRLSVIQRFGYQE
jgi:hypothetical protein